MKLATLKNKLVFLNNRLNYLAKMKVSRSQLFEIVEQILKVELQIENYSEPKQTPIKPKKMRKQLNLGVFSKEQLALDFIYDLQYEETVPKNPIKNKSRQIQQSNQIQLIPNDREQLSLLSA